MNKLIKGLAVVGAGLAVAKGIKTKQRYDIAKQQLEDGTVDTWIQEVVGDTAYEIEPLLGVTGLCTADQSKIYLRLSTEDLLSVALANVDFKDAVQAVAAHEKGHAVDEEIPTLLQQEKELKEKGDIEGYASVVLYREQRAWDLGKQFLSNHTYYNKFNKNNMQAYKINLLLERLAQKLTKKGRN